MDGHIAFCSYPGKNLKHVQWHSNSRKCSTKPRFRACAEQVLTVEDVKNAAVERGLELKDDSKGPVLTMDVLRDGKLTAYINGAVLPKERLHIEAYKAKSKEGGTLLDVSPGMLIFMAALAFGASRGCKEVYGLAIKDDPKQHQRLLRYLKRFGGVEVKKVGMKLADIPDRLLYGGVGMIVKGDLISMLRRSKGMLERTKPKILT